MGVQNLGPVKKMQAKKTSVTQGALTANTYATVLSVTGAGVFNYLRYTTSNLRTINFRITIDSTVVSTGAATSVSGSTFYFFGQDNASMSASLPVINADLFFKTSLLIEIQSTSGAIANDMTTDIYFSQEV